ncbi:MAG: N-acetylmuramoyl-L-alanine amidase [Alphaproteobacteria bacterium]|nr:N-acetylmuramoyl-L-alanine amidase [Alphaproteobacteria bacterium]
MNALRSIGLALVTVAGVFLAAVNIAGAQPVVSDVRLGQQPDATRLVLDLSEPIEFSIFRLDRPYRLVIDLPPVGWALAPGIEASELGVVKGFRYGRLDSRTSRIVVDMTGPVEVASAFMLPPQGNGNHRLVIDLRDIGREQFVAALAPPPAPVQPTQPVAIIDVRPQGKPVVAIDPGHGGIDPGTIGVTGVREKTVTLALAKELRQALEATGHFEVVLTRESDVFVPLRERVARARAAGAELFISLHADSVNASSVRGASVYTLSTEASGPEAAALAAKENQADVIGGMDLGQYTGDLAAILIDLAQQESMNVSASFAARLIPELASEARVLRNTHRFAGFAVLKAPDVPSVLVEMGYLSNRSDEQMLASANSRQPLVRAMTRAIDSHFADLGG